MHLVHIMTLLFLLYFMSITDSPLSSSYFSVLVSLKMHFIWGAPPQLNTSDLNKKHREIVFKYLFTFPVLSN